MKKNFLFLSITTILISCRSTAPVYQRLATGKVEGMHSYILPKAAFLIEAPVTTTTIKRKSAYQVIPADVAAVYKKRYGFDPEIYGKLSANPTATELTVTEYAVADDSVKITCIPVPDYSKVFYIDPQTKWNKNQSVTFNYSADGLLTEGESVIENKTFDITVKGLSSLVSIIGAFFKGPNGDVSKTLTTAEQKKIPELDEILAQFAKLELLGDHDIYKDLKAELEKKYNAVFAEIFYSVKEKVKVHKLLYTPSKDINTANAIDIFELDAGTGKLWLNTAISTYLWSTDLDARAMGSTAYKMKFKPYPEQAKDYFTDRDDARQGFAYNIPLKALVTMLNDKSKVIAAETVKIPQLGIVGFTNTTKEKLVFSLDNFGELKKLSIESKAVLTDQVASAAGVATETITTVKGESAATKLENEVKMLENEKKKRELLKLLAEEQ